MKINVAFWITLIRGILAVSLGVVLLFQTDMARPILGNFMGMYWLVAGLMSLRWGARGERVRGFPVLAGIPPIITRADIVRKRWKRVALATGTIGVIVAGIVVFHLMVMDLNVFWAKLMRKLPI